MLPPHLTDHESVLEAMSEEEWKQWRHEPITRAFLKFIDDQMANFREQASDMVESGRFDANSPIEKINPQVVRGKLLALAGLQALTVEAIKGFYRDKREAGQTGI